jgi:Zn-dependent alcohol dehydrogenase
MPTPGQVVVVPGQPGPLQIREVQLPDPGPHQVVVRQFASGICHSQLHQMHRPRVGVPQVLGHESTGVVVARGSAVQHVDEGDHVLLTWVPRRPDFQRRPEPLSLDIGGGETATTRNTFTWADTTLTDEQFVVKLDRAEKTDVTAIIGCAVMTGSGAVQNTANVQRDQSVVVFGTGGVGLSAVAAAAVAGANPIVAVDLDPAKLELAKRFGATQLVDASKEDPVERVRAYTPRPGETDLEGMPVAGADFAFDCIGVPVTSQQILASVRNGAFGRSRGGTAVIVGFPTRPVEMELVDIMLHEKLYIGSIGGSCEPDRDFPMFLRWYHDGDLDLDALVTARYPLDRINEATDALAAGHISGRAIIQF